MGVLEEYSRPPSNVKLHLTPFKAHVDEQKIQEFKTLLKLSPVASPNYENSDKSVNRRYGVSRDWILNAKQHWLNNFDWRRHEDRINSFPSYLTTVKDDVGHDLTIHFIALWSQRQDAIPLVFFHGWPSSFLEFLPILDLLKQKYSPHDLPYHVIVPSLPGYAYSSGPPLNYDYSLENAAEALNNLLVGLGFTSYVVQGGDLGSYISRYLATTNEHCQGMHVNFAPMSRPTNSDELPLTQIEKEGLRRGLWFRDVASAYAYEHGSKTATIGLALSASPVALLCWIGEKFLELTDEDPSLDDILASVTLYWMTDTFPRCIYHYRAISGGDERPRIARFSGRGPARPYVEKPSGYSFFPKEAFPIPISWVATNVNLIHSKLHTSGGHFAAMEKPKELLEDVEEYISKLLSARKS